MSVLFLATSILGLAAAVAGSLALYRLWSRRKVHGSLRRRLSSAYAPATAAADLHPLRSPPGPPGQVGVTESGLLLDLLTSLGKPDLRAVPWASIERVGPAPGGAVMVRIERVGSVVVPSALGRPIWEGIGAREQSEPGAPA